MRIFLLGLLFAMCAVGAWAQAAPDTTSAVAKAESGTLTDISALPKVLEGRWETVGQTFRFGSNTLKAVIFSQEGGKITGTFTSYGTGSPSDPCHAFVDVPMEGTWDGKTLKIRAKAENGCVKSYTFQAGEGHMFYRGSPTKAWLDPVK